MDALDAIQESNDGKIAITDCSMGKCFDTLKSVKCTIDSNETQTEKRFACELTNTQE